MQHFAFAGVPGLGPGVDRTLLQRKLAVRHDQRGIVLQGGPEPGADGAAAIGIVEGEELGLRLEEGRPGVAGAAERLGEAERLSGPLGDRNHHCLALTFPETRRQGIGHTIGPAPVRILHDPDPVNHDQHLPAVGQIGNGRARFGLWREQVGQLRCHAVHEHPHEPQRAQILRHETVRHPPAPCQGEGDHGACTGRQGRDAIGGGRDGVRAHLVAALGAPRAAGAREEQAEEVVDLGRGAHGGAAGGGGVALLDGHCGGESLDPVDIRLLQAVEELFGVGRKGLDVAALASREEGVERQGGLSGPRRPGDDRERVPGQVQIDVLQVVLASTPDPDRLVHGLLPWAAGFSTGCRPPLP